MIFCKLRNPIICRKFFKNIVVELQKTFQLIGEHKIFLQEGLLMCIEAIVAIVDTDLTEDDAKQIYELVKGVFSNIGDVNATGLMVISYVAAGMKERFEALMDDFWKYINHAFAKVQQPDMLKAALIAVSHTA